MYLLQDYPIQVFYLSSKYTLKQSLYQLNMALFQHALLLSSPLQHYLLNFLLDLTPLSQY